MNNRRLLVWLCAIAISGWGICRAESNGRTMSLEELFEAAETGNARLRTFAIAEKVAGKEIEEARAARLPDISTSLTVSYLGDGFTTNRSLSDFQKAPIPHFGSGFEVGVRQPVYTGGAITAGIEMAELKSVSARLSTQMNRNDVRIMLTEYYLNIYKLRNLRDVVAACASQAEMVLKEMKARYEQGTVLQNDITRYELLLSGLKLQLIKINNDIEISNRNLSVIAGLPEGTVIQPDSSLLSRSLPAAGADWWREEAIVNSPVLKIARNGIEMSRKSEELVKVGRRPKVGLEASWSINGPILVEVPPINRNLSYWYVGVGVSYDLSSLYKSRSALSGRQAAVQMAVSRLEEEEENVRLAVSDSYLRYQEAYNELSTQEKSLELAERNYNTIRTRYMAGMALVTDLVDAANSRLDAHRMLVDARINIIYRYYNLLYITGKI